MTARFQQRYADDSGFVILPDQPGQAPKAKPQAIVIGASAGAVEALSILLPSLPAGYGLPILIVVHLRPDTAGALPGLFAAKCRMAVKEAEDKEIMRSGVAYFAPPNYHLLVETDGTLSLSSEEPEFFSRPSINVLFESAAEAFGAGLIGIILTGANEDGAHGLRKIADFGGLALVQDPKTADAATMPQSALAACPGARVMDLKSMADFLVKIHDAD